MSKKCTTLCLAAITGCKSPSAINVTLHHNVATVAQPTEQTPDTFNIVNMTEKFMDPEIVDNTLLSSQRNTDTGMTMDDPGEVKASP